MPDFRFCLDLAPSRDLSVDLPDLWAVDAVARQVARKLAAREIGNGRLKLAQDMIVRDRDDTVIARYALSSFLQVEM